MSFSALEISRFGSSGIVNSDYIPDCITSINAPARSLRLSSRLDQIYLIDSIASKANFGYLSKIRVPARFAGFNHTYACASLGNAHAVGGHNSVGLATK